MSIEELLKKGEETQDMKELECILKELFTQHDTVDLQLANLVEKYYDAMT